MGQVKTVMSDIQYNEANTTNLGFGLSSGMSMSALMGLARLVVTGAFVVA
jgi:hypothetical protein